MDDTWAIQQQAHKELFLDHINSIDPSIKFTVEGNLENGAIPCLDTLVKPEVDNSLSIRVCCKTHPYRPVHSGIVLTNLSAMYSVIGTLTHRAKSVCTAPALLDLLDEELQHLKRALVRCKYPRWAINKVINKVINGNREDSGNTQVSNSAQDNTGTNAGHIVIPYIRGWGKALSTHAPSMAQFKKWPVQE